MFQPFLRFYEVYKKAREALETLVCKFQPFLRFYPAAHVAALVQFQFLGFQPFLRFYCSCVWFLWVFKFFFGFL